MHLADFGYISMAAPPTSVRGSAFTEEGNKGGDFAAKLEKQRAAARADFEAKKAALEAETARVVAGVDSKFVAASDGEGTAAGTVQHYGLMRVGEAKELEQKAAAARLKAELLPVAAGAATAAVASASESGAALKRKRAVLSFARDDEEEESDDGGAPGRGAFGRGPARPTSSSSSSSSSSAAAAATAAAKPAGAGVPSADPAASGSSAACGGAGAAPDALSPPAAAAAGGATAAMALAKRPKLGKDPTVATDFLPDAERERAAAELTERLRREFEAKMETERAEKLRVTYSWWDGSGHRREIVIQKGFTVGKFLEMVRAELLPQFPSLRTVPADGLIYVKEDLIMPSHITFHELIARKARGKSGPLFAFDVYDDVRLKADARMEKDESHPGKVIERRWYEKNKHAFPASRWELFDWKTQDKFAATGYTTHGHEVQKEGKR